MRLILLLFLLFFSVISLAQPLERRYSIFNQNCSGTGIAEMSGGYIATAVVDDCGQCDVYFALIRIDDNGNTVWTTLLNPASTDGSAGKPIIHDNSFIFPAAAHTVVGANDTYSLIVYRTDTSGNLMWDTHITDSTAYFQPVSVIADSAAIHVCYNDLFNGRVYLSTLTHAGTILQTRQVAQSAVMRQCVDMQLHNGRLFFAGTGDQGGVPKSILHVENLNGTSAWSRYYSNDTLMISSFATDGQHIYLNGVSADSGGYVHLTMVKVDTVGQMVMRTQIPAFETCYPATSLISNDGNLLMSGVMTDGSPDTRMFMMKTDLNGNLLWEKEYCMQNCFATAGRHLIETSDSMLVALGLIQMVQGESEIYFVRTNGMGSLSAIDEKQSREGLTIYPIPTGRFIHIDPGLIRDLLHVNLFDMEGRLCKKIKIKSSQNIRIDLEGLNSGIYLMHVSGKDIDVRKKIVLR